MEADEIEESVAAIRHEVVENVVRDHLPPGSLEEQWDLEGLKQVLASEFGLGVAVDEWVAQDKTMNDDAIVERCIDASDRAYEARAGMIGEELMRNVEKQVMLRQLDMHWKEHLAGMDHLRQGIGLRSYAQKNPKQEYKREAFEMFGEMLEQVKYDTISYLCRIRVQAEEDLDDSEERRRAAEAMRYQHAQASALGSQPAQGQNPQGQPQQRGAPPPAPKPETFKRDGRKVGRNEPCPCGSGKKFKQCHGKLT